MKKIIMKFVLCIYVLLAGVFFNHFTSLAAEVSVTEQNFPDSAFRNYISKEIDKDKNGVLSDAEIIQTTKIEIKGYELGEDGIAKNYQGIECFTELEELKIVAVFNGKDSREKYVDISLDVSGNQKLKRFSCKSGRVQNLDLSVCPLLEKIMLQTEDRPVQDLSKNANRGQSTGQTSGADALYRSAGFEFTAGGWVGFSSLS